ncbi:MAG: site-specific DNA-methyltransferase, partial [Candidatus Micrarchaeota archaeon]|nr:site-specific DNA-methyltransferase [Candidatus Micrarchaeota archaeon]
MAKKVDYSTWSKEELIREIETLKKRKKYGLVWEDKPEDVAQMCKEKLPILSEVKSKEITTDKNADYNILIEGDNYHALAALNFTHANSIDVIYIDPPYNTGNKDFKYNDKWVDREDAYRHSKWLSFMEKRLKLAKELLSKEGLIFISIDDNEYAQLKILCDEIFTEGNYRNSIIIRRGAKNVQAQFDTIDRLSSGYEFVLVYSKNSKYRLPKQMRALEEKREGSWNNHWRGTDRPTMRYKLFGITPKEGQWRWSEERSLKAIDNYKKMLKDIGKKEVDINQQEIDRWYLKKSTETEEELDLLRLSKNNKPEHYIPPTDNTLLNDVWFDVPPNSSRKLTWIFGKKVFDNPKPLELIWRILQFSNKNATILDFFAGSGTTAHAVL